MALSALFFSFCVVVQTLVLVLGAPTTGIDLTKLKPVTWKPVAYKNESSRNSHHHHHHRYHFPQARIVGGQVAFHAALPYMVALILDHVSFCGGSLISVDYVLTSAHCTYGKSNYVIILGIHNMAESEDSEEYRTASSVHNHPGYNANERVNDIAIIKLSNSVTLNNAIKTINLAPRNAGEYVGTTAVVSGWGKINDETKTTSLHYVSLTVMNNEYCSEIFENVIHDSHVCTFGINGSHVVGPCLGDSGGPLVHNGMQIGIVSFGASSCVEGYPSVYTRVSSFRNWIAEITGV